MMIRQGGQKGMMMAKNAAKMFSPHDKNTADIDDDDIDDIDRYIYMDGYR